MLLIDGGTPTSSKRATVMALVPKGAWPEGPFNNPLTRTDAEIRTGRWYTPTVEPARLGRRLLQSPVKIMTSCNQGGAVPINTGEEGSDYEGELGRSSVAFP